MCSASGLDPAKGDGAGVRADVAPVDAARLRIDQVMTTCLKYLVPISCFLFLGGGHLAAGLGLPRWRRYDWLPGRRVGRRLCRPATAGGDGARERRQESILENREPKQDRRCERQARSWMNSPAPSPLAAIANNAVAKDARP